MADSLKQQYGDWALITGACSGIGKAFATECVAQGLNCILISSDSTRLQQTQQELQVINPQLILHCYAVDLANETQIKALLCEQSLEHVRLVINCAGYGYTGKSISQPLQFYSEMIKVNAQAPMFFSLHFANLFVHNRKKGAIINVTSANCELNYPIPNFAVYTASKYFTKYFTEALAYELKREDIDVLNVACGPTNTNFQATAKTVKVPWCETPQSVVKRSLQALGRKASIITHPRSRLMITLLKYAPLSHAMKLNIVAKFYRSTLGGPDAF